MHSESSDGVPASNPRYLMVPVRSSSLVTGLAFLLFTLFILNTWPEDEGLRLQQSLQLAVSSACWLVSWLEMWCTEYVTCQTVTFCLHSLSLLLVSWLGQAGLLALLQVILTAEQAQ